MSVTGHRWIGVAFAFWVAAWCRYLKLPVVDDWCGGLAAFWGSTAPDWLELAKGVRQRHLFGLFAKDTWKRASVIPHRTVTHWAVLWIALLVFASVTLRVTLPFISSVIHASLFGFAVGGVGHLICDLPNPTGVPIVTPFPAARRSLHLWKSGDRREWLMVLAAWGAAAAMWL